MLSLNLTILNGLDWATLRRFVAEGVGLPGEEQILVECDSQTGIYTLVAHVHPEGY